MRRPARSRRLNEHRNDVVRILITTYGSRGDVQPMVALATALRDQGADVRFCAPADPEFVELLARYRLPLIPAFSSVRDWVARAKALGLRLPELSKLMIAEQYEVLAEAAQGCSLVMATGLFPAKAAAQAVAEKQGLRFVGVHFCPRYLPSPDLPPVEFPGWPHPADETDNRALWTFNAKAMNGLFEEAVNAHRTAIGLPALENVRDHVFSRRPLLASDPMLGRWQPSDICDGIQVGAFVVDDPRPLPGELAAFLDAGPPPIYVGFGSMAMQTAPDAARAAITAIRARGGRTVLARGVAGLSAVDDGTDCFVTGEVNQQKLFPRVAAIIHHGGAGTTFTAAQAGTAQLIVPQVADQFYWAARVADLGIGVAHDGSVPSSASLTAGLDNALERSVIEKARAIAGRLRTDAAIAAARMLRALG
jgi:vancomycin aglycone glucosyltransferase